MIKVVLSVSCPCEMCTWSCLSQVHVKCDSEVLKVQWSYRSRDKAGCEFVVVLPLSGPDEV